MGGFEPPTYSFTYTSISPRERFIRGLDCIFSPEANPCQSFGPSIINMSATVLTKSDLAFNRYSGFIPMLPSEWAVFPTMELLYQLSYIGSKSINKFLN